MNYLLSNRNRLFVLLVLALYLLSVLLNLGTLEFSGEEPRRAMISVEMLTSHNFIHPTQYGWDYYNKPPAFNWVLAFVIWVAGSASEFVLRLPSLVFYLLMAFVHYKVGRRFFPRKIALLSSLFLLTCADVYTYGLAYGAEIDVFYSLIVYLQAISLFWFYTKQEYFKLFVVSYLFCAIGFLTKAFPSLIFQVLTLGALCAYARSFRVLFRWEHFVGLVVFVAIVGGYFFLYSQYSSPGRYLLNLLNEAMLKSAVGERADRLLDKAVIYPWLFVKMFAPWFLLLLLLFSKVKFAFRSHPLVWFSLLFIVFNIWVYWLTGQPKIRYVYMFLPFGCVVLTQIYYRFTESYPLVFNQIMKYLGVVFGLVLLLVIGFPFIEKAPIGWVIGLASGLGALLYFYYRLPFKRIWLFVTGFMLVRLVYAALFIPLQYRGIESYNAHVANVVKATKKGALQYWAGANAFPVQVNTALFTYEAEVIRMPAVLPLEVPYYYYRNTGKIIRFDTVRDGTPYFVSYLGQIGDKPIDTLYSYFDKNTNQEVVFYRLKQ